MLLTKNKIIFSTLGTALTTGVTLFSINSSKGNETIPERIEEEQKKLPKVSFRKKYEVALIDGEGNFWNSRIDELMLGEPKHEGLKKVKSLEVWEKLEQITKACGEISNFEEDSEWFSDFQSFCVMKNKDGSSVISSKDGFNSKYNNFSKTKRDTLSLKFADIWDKKGDSINEEWKQKMLDECQRLKEKMYVNDIEDRNFESYCKN